MMLLACRATTPNEEKNSTLDRKANVQKKIAIIHNQNSKVSKDSKHSHTLHMLIENQIKHKGIL